MIRRSFFPLSLRMLLLLPLAANFFFLLGGVSGQDYTDECPELNGFFADAVQCDRYYECKNGEILDHLCPDGLVYDESSAKFAKCSFPFSVDCTGRPELQPAQASVQCPRRNGYFGHEDSGVCDKFYFCVDGVPNSITCPQTLIFDPEKGQCAFSDQVVRKGCSSEEIFQFTCPDNPDAAHAHPRYPDPKDCQFFYLCINGNQPRRNGCTVGLVFNPDTLSCDRPSNVPGKCQDWYNSTFIESINGPPRANNIPVGGTKLSNTPGRTRVAVRRRRPNPSSNSIDPGTAPGGVPSPSQFQSQSTGGRVRVDQNTRGSVPLRGAAQAATNNANANRNRVRTRVSRPRTPVAAAAPPAPLQPFEQGPPSFALSSDEDIQRFRDSNLFVPERTAANTNGGGRLTVLTSDFRTRGRLPPSGTAREEQPATDEDKFSSFPAVPSRGGGNSPSSSRRTPAGSSSFSRNSFAGDTGFSRVPSIHFEDEKPFVPAQSAARQEADFGGRQTDHSDPFQTSFGGNAVRAPTPAAPRRPPSRTSLSRERTRESSSSSAAASQTQQQSSRSRLQVTPINIRPQLDLAAADDPADFEIRRIPSQRQRSRGRQTF